MRPETLGVIGLGAIGGSLAWRARKAGIRVLGWSPRPAERAHAVQLGALDDAPARPEDVAQRADLLVLAVPPHASEELLARLAPSLSRSALATDVATVKRGIVARAESLGLGARFAGSHPFVTVRGRGFAASRSDLFAGAVVYVCPVGDDLTAAREIAHFWEVVLGATTVLLEPGRHDAQIAWSCHLPGVIAGALSSLVRNRVRLAATVGEPVRDATRAIAGTEQAGALLDNADNVVVALDALVGELQAWRLLLTRHDGEALARQLDHAAEWRDRIGE